MSIARIKARNLRPGNNQEFNFDSTRIFPFKRFAKTVAIAGANYGDEGKGKISDYIASLLKSANLKVLSARGQGSGNAGHTVQIGENKYHFHYLPSAGFTSDLILLGGLMLIDPIRVLKEALQLPPEQRNKIVIAERAALVTNVERKMDKWCEIKRNELEMSLIGTTGSGVGPGAGNRGYRFHMTFADALNCKDFLEFKNQYLKNPLLPEEVKAEMTDEYAAEMFEAIHQLNVVDSVALINKCKAEGDWALVLEVSQAMGLDPTWGHEGHNVTSTPTNIIGAAYGLGLSMADVPDLSIVVTKVYESKVGGGTHPTKFVDSEHFAFELINTFVPERGVTTGRVRDLGWFDAVLTRYALSLNGGAYICVNCMDVILEMAKILDKIPICVTSRHKETGEEEYDYKYWVSQYDPVFKFVPVENKSDDEIIKDYISAIERYTGGKVIAYGIGPKREDLVLLEDIEGILGL